MSHRVVCIYKYIDIYRMFIHQSGRIQTKTDKRQTDRQTDKCPNYVHAHDTIYYNIIGYSLNDKLLIKKHKF